MLLERWPHAGGVERKAMLSIMREIEELNLEEKDILSMADLGVAMVASLPKMHPEAAASNMLCLLKPIEEEPLPSKRTADWRIWEIFPAAEVQWQQILVLSWYGAPLAESPLVMSTRKKLADLVAAFKDVQSQLEGRISSDLHSKMTEFTRKLESHTETVWYYTPSEFSQSFILGADHELNLEASEIARELRSLPNLPGASPESSEEPGSWSLIEDTAMPAEVHGDVAADVGSVASCQSVDTQMSYLAGGFMKTVLPVLFISLKIDPKGLYDE